VRRDLKKTVSGNDVALGMARAALIDRVVQA
jgi:hypothetical protein